MLNPTAPSAAVDPQRDYQGFKEKITAMSVEYRVRFEYVVPLGSEKGAGAAAATASCLSHVALEQTETLDGGRGERWEAEDAQLSDRPVGESECHVTLSLRRNHGQ